MLNRAIPICGLLWACLAPAMGQNAGSAARSVRHATAPPVICIINTEKLAKSRGNGDTLKRVLSEIGSCRCVEVHYSKVTPAKLAGIHPAAVVLTGQGTPWTEYSDAELAGVCQALRETRYPVLGVCGGHQLIAKAFHARVAPIKVISNAPGYAGCLRQRGFTRLDCVALRDPLFGGIGPHPVFWENHAEEIKTTPAGSQVLVRESLSPIQAIRYGHTMMYGVQFHPERFTKEHPDGRRVLLNFLALSGVGRAD